MIIDEVTLICLRKCSEQSENNIKRNPPYPSSCYRSAPLSSAEFVLMRDGVEIDRFSQLAEANAALVRIAELTPCMPVVAYVDIDGYNCAQSARFPLGSEYKVIPMYNGDKKMKVYIVEAFSYDDYERVAVCASLERAMQVLKAEAEDEAEQLTKYGNGDITWDKDGLGFLAGRTQYQIVETEVIE